MAGVVAVRQAAQCCLRNVHLPSREVLSNRPVSAKAASALLNRSARSLPRISPAQSQSAECRLTTLKSTPHKRFELAALQEQIEDDECRAVAGLRSPLDSSEPSSKPISQAATTLILGLAALLLAGGVAEPALAAELNSNLGSNLAASFDLFEDLGNLREGFVSAFLLIFFSEIGDKTFFIAVLLALKRNKAAVFAGTFGALAVMTFITVILGRVFHVIDEALPFDKTWEAEIPLDDVAAVLLLTYFGLSTLKDAYTAEEGDGDEEKESAEAAVASFGDGAAALSSFDLGTVAATFALVFAAEWGDKSFFSTIALAAAGSPLGVVGGAVVGHGIATVLAVVGGSILSRYISPKIIGYAGGSLFLVFAAVTLFDITSKLP